MRAIHTRLAAPDLFPLPFLLAGDRNLGPGRVVRHCSAVALLNVLHLVCAACICQVTYPGRWSVLRGVREDGVLTSINVIAVYYMSR